MQALSVLPLPHKFLVADEFSYISAKFDQDQFTFDLKMDHDDENFRQEEFSFSFLNHQESLVTADEIFDNGRIRPFFPDFDRSTLFAASMPRPPLKKLFVEQHCRVEDKPLHDLMLKTTTRRTLKVGVDDSKERCKKSNSTGFSKLWMFRQEVDQLRSNSDGKNAFVFLNRSALAKPKRSCDEVKVKNDVVKKGKHKVMSSLTPHEKLYTKKESDKRRSFLPYRQQLVGFFANTNGFTRNILPF